MRIQDLAYRVSARTIELLEETQHYKIPEELRKQVTSTLLDELDTLIKQA